MRRACLSHVLRPTPTRRHGSVPIASNSSKCKAANGGDANESKKIAGRCGLCAAALAASLSGPLQLAPAQAYAPPPSAQEIQASLADAPPKSELPLDGGSSYVLDYGRVLRGNAKLKLDSDLQRLQEDTGWKLVVLTSYGEGTAPPLRALQQYWKADSKTIIVSVDEFKGNVLEFYYDSVNPVVKQTIPRNVFQELRGRYGNVYYMKETGAESAVMEVTNVLRGCLNDGGCKFVPGLSQQQREFSLIAVTSGAFLSGAVLRNTISKWTYIFLFIWVPWIFLFGFYPLYVRQPDNLTPLFQNVGIFGVIFSLMYLTPLIGEVKLPAFARGKDSDSDDISPSN
eukprot:CAMPEP_0114238522 /NCGR_PEP_ID=MMETSP0058-20121206/7969_1 /TAXON_ID=36894 /ORGANISM="Pyramimonas parkeae, CCMP726" /LENGTH=340 /DNA_ID=CAMNT_0001350637 /DNA_START=285 /DNA_END=1307 /DNA_ORIENTATION=-